MRLPITRRALLGAAGLAVVPLPSLARPAPVVGAAVVTVEDWLFAPSTVRFDGAATRGALLLQVRGAGASQAAWDACNVVSVVPASGHYVPLGEGHA